MEGVHFVAGPWFAVHQSGSDWQLFDHAWISDGQMDQPVKIEFRLRLNEPLG